MEDSPIFLNSKKNNNSNLILNSNYKVNQVKKIRNPGIELIRIFAMYCIIIHHTIAHGGLFKKYIKYNKILNLIIIFCLWHVCSFGLISGIVGYKKNKYSNLIYLWFCVFFYSLSIHLIIKFYKNNSMVNQTLFSEFFPVVLNKYWYFSKYFGMFLFLPIINNGIANLSKSELKLLIINIIGLFVILNDIINPKRDTFNLVQGHSILGLLIFYIIGAYIGKYCFYDVKSKFLFSSACIIIFISSGFLTYKLNFDPLDELKSNYKTKIIIILKNIYSIHIISFPTICQAISISLFLIQIKTGKILNKIINYLGPLTFGAYLLHENILIRKNITEKLFKNDSSELALSSIFIKILFRSLIIYIICFIIETFRNLIFNICRIKRLSLYIEQIIFNLSKTL